MKTYQGPHLDLIVWGCAELKLKLFPKVICQNDFFMDIEGDSKISIINVKEGRGGRNDQILQWDVWSEMTLREDDETITGETTLAHSAMFNSQQFPPSGPL
ncbi:hypothetical protein AVEN_117181-1 [Araneus ventricosus]|uniref:Uncharacterized protein n=1 Tax=Araneus ventricosus TaxID=182803 RepID=A0A4Y2AXZ8_ARAVE|nr:hypothetical protein AVEN_117181-1 [Araneus ventricosus]